MGACLVLWGDGLYPGRLDLKHSWIPEVRSALWRVTVGATPSMLVPARNQVCHAAKPAFFREVFVFAKLSFEFLFPCRSPLGHVQ